MIDGDAPTVSITSNVIQGQDEAVIDVAQADLGLAYAACDQVILRRAEEKPVLRHLQSGAAEDSLAAVEEADLGLGGVIPEHDLGGPAPEIGGCLELGA